MADFQLDTSGCVVIPTDDPRYIGERWFWWSNLSPFTQGYVEAALTDLNTTVGRTWAFRNLAPETLAKMIADCAAWARERGPGWEGVGPGQHFWRVRAEEFDGFGPIAGLDLKRRFPPLTLYLGDDGKVYAGPLNER